MLSMDFGFDLEDTYEPAVRQLKTEEEIQKYVVDESLDPVNRFVHILSKGEEIQKQSALSSAPNLLSHCEPKEKEGVLKELCRFVGSSGEDYHLLMAEQLPQLLRESVVSEHLFLKLVFPTVIQGLQSRNSTISQAWNNCLLEVLPFLPKEVLKSDILPIVRRNSDLRQTVQTRTFSCRLVSKMAEHYETSLIMQDLVPIIKHLCQDIEYEVRWNMGVSLVPIVASVDSKTTVNILLPELIELTNDEEKIVKFKALATLVDFVSYLDEESILSTVLPTVDRYIESTSLKHDPNIVEVSRVFGALCYHLGSHLTEDQKNYYLSFFRKLSTNGLTDSGSGSKTEKYRRDSTHFMPSNKTQESDMNVDCRQYAAFNFPAILRFCGTNDFSTQLERSLTSLATDPAVPVRRTIAVGFHEVVKYMSPKSVVLENTLYQLLSDDNVEIKSAVTKHLDIIIIYMYDSSISDVTRKSMQEKIAEAIIDCYEALRVSHDWRATANIIRHFCSIPNCFTDEITYRKIYPLVNEVVASHAARPIKEAACETLAWLVRSNRKFDQRTEMVSNLITNLSASQSSAQRLIFVELCRCFSKNFSRKFFKENLFEHVINLSTDKVVDVRLALSKFLPHIKSMLRLPVDSNLLRRLESAVRNLINQDYQNRQSSTVTSTIRHYLQLCDQQETIVESALDQVPRNEEDVIDQTKEDEERSIEMHHKQRRRKSLPKTSPLQFTSKPKVPSDFNGTKNTKNSTTSPTSHSNGSLPGGSASPFSPSMKSPVSHLNGSKSGNGHNSPSSKKGSFRTHSSSGTFSPMAKNDHAEKKQNGVHDLRRASMPVNLPSETVQKKTATSKASAKK